MTTAWLQLYPSPWTGEKLCKASWNFIVSRHAVFQRVALRFITITAACKRNEFQTITYESPTVKGEKKDTKCPLPPVYSPQYVEAAWYDWWVTQGFFHSSPQQATRNKEQFVMLLPPPNITGTLHLGHALTNSIQDALIRWHRMKGDFTLWVPGMDHAGIATQVMVEKMLWNEKQQTRQQLGRDRFEMEVWKWKQDKESVIETQMKSLGSSFDWNHQFFTLDENLSSAVVEAFVCLHEKGKVYRSRQMINWSCSLQSSISDIEVDSIQVTGRTRFQIPGYTDKVEFGLLSSFAYPVQDLDEEIVVSTTRLETMLGDSAVAVHPDDQHYAHLVGRMVYHPLCHRLLPIIADSFVDRQFGSGAVKVTPGHDPVDLQVGRKHNLAELSILDDAGKICGDVPEPFSGMLRFKAREAVRTALTDLGLYRGEVDHTMLLPMCSRSGDVVERRLKEQWFLSCRQMADRAVQAVQRGALTFSAAHHEAIWFDWLANIKDWCLSRQLWWGHRVPAYKFQTDEGEMWLTARNEQLAISKFTQQWPDKKYHTVSQDEDVLDTWFSSSLLPLSVFGWPHIKDETCKLYPLSMMETGQDILFFWVARMVMLGLELTDTLPFRHVLLHGIVRDVHGRKMSKSLGNVVDPMDIISGASLTKLQSKLESTGLSSEELQTARSLQSKQFPQGIPACGADALRFTLCSYDFKADAVPWDVLHVRKHSLFCNKIWQAFRFTQQHIQEDFTPLDTYCLSGEEDAVDLWILSCLSQMIWQCHEAFTSHSLQDATRALHQFFLNKFCDVYLECSKMVFQSANLQHQHAVRQLLFFISQTFLQALSPFMPFLSEELYQRLPVQKWKCAESICIASYPQPQDFQWHDKTLEREMSQVLEMNTHILAVRHRYNITKENLPVFVKLTRSSDQCTLRKFVRVLNKLSKASPLHIVSDDMTDCIPDGCVTASVNSSSQLYMQLTGYVDLSQHHEYLSQRWQKISSEQEMVTNQLSELIKKGKGHLTAAQKLQTKEQALIAQLRLITTTMEDISKLRSS